MQTLGEKRPTFNGKPLSVESLHRKVDHAGFTGIYHYHEYLELIYCITGEFELLTFDTQRHMYPGDLVFINANTAHGIRYLSECSEHYCIKFSHDILFPDKGIAGMYNHFMNVLSDFKGLEYFNRQRVESSDIGIKETFEKLHDAFSKKHYGYEFCVHACVLQIMSFVFRQNYRPPVPAQSENHLQLEKWNIDAYISDRLATVNLSDMAGRYFMSYSYFSKTFKSIFGMPFKKYLVKKRINESMRLLTETEMSITEIALTVGFSTSSHFIKVFREEKNISPGKFRQKTKLK